MEPTLITLYAGGNDILDFGTDMDLLMADYERLVARLAATGATLVLFTGYDVKVSAVLEPFKKRNALYNERVRELAAKYGAVLVDYWCLDAYHDRRMWASDRLHMSKAGHKYMAAQVLDHLGVPHKISPKDWEPPQRLKLRDWERRQRRWVNDWVLPLFGRKLRGVTLGDSLRPRWPEPVKVPRKAGLRKLAERQAAAAAHRSRRRRKQRTRKSPKRGDMTMATHTPLRFVAVGDSFTEGVGDTDLRLPNDCRGWADRVAEELARHRPQTQYANLALRGRRLRQIVVEQLEPALAMAPTLVSFHAGGNDLLGARLDMRTLVRGFEDAVARIAAKWCPSPAVHRVQRAALAGVGAAQAAHGGFQQAHPAHFRSLRNASGGPLVLRKVPGPPDVGSGPAAHVRHRTRIHGQEGPGGVGCRALAGLAGAWAAATAEPRRDNGRRRRVAQARRGAVAFASLQGSVERRSPERPLAGPYAGGLAGAPGASPEPARL